MKSSSLQFHATHTDLYEMIEEYLTNEQYYVAGVVLFPYQIINPIVCCDAEDIKKYDFIVISKSIIDNEAENNFAFLKKQRNNLIIEVGVGADTSTVYESVIQVMADEIDAEWKKKLASVKKTFCKGAYIVNPNVNEKYYNKNFYYTQRIRQEHENNGVVIKPFPGPNYYQFE